MKAAERQVLRHTGPAIRRGVDEKRIFDFLARLNLSVGTRVALQQGARWALDASREEAAGGLMDHLGPAVVEFVPVLAEANAPPEMLREAIRGAVLFAHKRLPDLVKQAGGRRAFAEWCRRAQFEIPDHLPEVVTIARGTHSVSPEVAVAGMHWSAGCPGSDAFDGAAFFAAGRPSAVVILARVPRSALIYFVDGVVPYEVLIEDVPLEYEVITDQARLTEGAVRFAYHRRALAALPGKVPFDPNGSNFDRIAANIIARDETRQAAAVSNSG